MTTTATPIWEARRTDESREVENVLRATEEFDRVDAYRYNSASIRVRVIASRFEGMPRDEREQMVETRISELPESIQRDIVNILCFAPSEMKKSPKTFREYMLNSEFEDPSPSML